MDVLVVGGNRFVGYELASRLRAGGHRLTLFNRGSRSDPFGERVERLRGDRMAGDFSRLLAGRRFDAVVDFAMFRGGEGALPTRPAAPADGQGRARLLPPAGGVSVAPPRRWPAHPSRRGRAARAARLWRGGGRGTTSTGR